MRLMKYILKPTLLLAVLALVVTACSSSSSEDSTTTTADNGATSTSAAPGTPTTGELVVGVLVPLTGELGSWGEDWAANYELAVADIEEAGLLPDGVTIRLVVEDETGSAETAIRAAKKLIEVDGVQVIVGPTSLVMVALDSLAKQYQIPIISPAAGTVRLDTLGGEWLYRTYPSDSAEGVALAEYFLAQNYTDVALLLQNEESAEGIGRVLRETFEAGGGTVLNDIEFDGGQPSYQAQVAQALAGDPDVLMIAAGEESARTIIREVRQAGYEGPLAVNGDLTSPGFLDQVGADLMERTCAGHATPDETTDLFTTYAAKYLAARGEETYVTQPNAYDSLILVVLAALAGGGTDGVTIRDNLRAVAGPPGVQTGDLRELGDILRSGGDVDYVGPSGILDFDESGTSPTPFSIQCVENGAWVG